jgi:hypothetical protein
MGKTKTPATVDTSAGLAAYTLATAQKAALAGRLPASVLAELAADLTLLGATIPAAQAPAPAGPPAPPPPSLAEATAEAVARVTAFHEAIRGAKATPAVSKAYGVSGKAAKEPKAVVAEGEKILLRAQAQPAEALSLGILPADTATLEAAIAGVKAAEAAATTGGAANGGTTAKERKAAEARVDAAVARIAGAGVLAFATDATTRAQFQALMVTKKRA